MGIARRIKDQIFIYLLCKALRAGYISFDKVFHSTNEGAPQGSVISPIISNIVIYKLDAWMEEVKAAFDKGERRRQNPVYTKIIRDV